MQNFNLLKCWSNLDGDWSVITHSRQTDMNRWSKACLQRCRGLFLALKLLIHFASLWCVRMFNACKTEPEISSVCGGPARLTRSRVRQSLSDECRINDNSCKWHPAFDHQISGRERAVAGNHMSSSAAVNELWGSGARSQSYLTSPHRVKSSARIRVAWVTAHCVRVCARVWACVRVCVCVMKPGKRVWAWTVTALATSAIWLTDHTVEVKSLHPPFRICKMLII